MPAYRDAQNGRWRYRKWLIVDGRKVRITGTPIINNKVAAEAAEREHIARLGVLPEQPAPEEPKKEVPTFEEFSKEFLSTYVANNNKPSERVSKEKNLRVHLLPHFGKQRLDEISTRDVEAFKAKKLEGGTLQRSSINNILITFGKLMRYAHELEIIEKLPRIRPLKSEPARFDFLEQHEIDQLLATSAQKSEEFHAAVLVGVDAGLRIGEIRALQWGDVDFTRGIITVRRNDWRGHVDAPKSGRDRKIPMTTRLAAALKSARHLKGELVFSTSRGTRWKDNNAQRVLDGCCRRAGLRRVTWHVLRHSFCSHLAMAGAPPRAVQELAGHAHITTTMRYMHLSPAAGREAIRLWNVGLLEPSIRKSGKRQATKADPSA